MSFIKVIDVKSSTFGVVKKLVMGDCYGRVKILVVKVRPLARW